MNELVILFLSLMVGWVIGIIPSLLLLRRLGIRQPNRNGAINREMMFEIDEEQLREIKDRYTQSSPRADYEAREIWGN